MTGNDMQYLLDLIGGLNDAGSWTGETHVQKCAYFLEAGLEVSA